MTKLELTLVRMKKTKEPVMATSYTGDILDLGRKIDEVVSPLECEYKDVAVDCSFQIVWQERNPSYKGMDEMEKVDFIDQGSLPEGLCFDLCDEFEVDEGWAEMPDGLSYPVVGPTIDDRLAPNKLQAGDVF